MFKLLKVEFISRKVRSSLRMCKWPTQTVEKKKMLQHKPSYKWDGANKSSLNFLSFSYFPRRSYKRGGVGVYTYLERSNTPLKGRPARQLKQIFNQEGINIDFHIISLFAGIEKIAAGSQPKLRPQQPPDH